jgi:GNAT superfamily N-acetyltransferase
MENSVLHERADEALSETSPTLAEARHAVAASAEMRHVTFDHLSDVRYLHSQALRNLASGELTDEEFTAAKAIVYSPKYVDALGTAIDRRQFFGSWIGETLVATAGWSTMDDAVTVARIRSIFVSPLYTRMGLAHELLRHVEVQAANAGFSIFSVRTMSNATGFFVRQGYVVTSHGVRSLLPDRPVPVTFLRKSLG